MFSQLSSISSSSIIHHPSLSSHIYSMIQELLPLDISTSCSYAFPPILSVPPISCVPSVPSKSVHPMLNLFSPSISNAKSPSCSLSSRKIPKKKTTQKPQNKNKNSGYQRIQRHPPSPLSFPIILLTTPNLSFSHPPTVSTVVSPPFPPFESSHYPSYTTT
jgi:hypothetical protein